MNDSLLTNEVTALHLKWEAGVRASWEQSAISDEKAAATLKLARQLAGEHADRIVSQLHPDQAFRVKIGWPPSPHGTDYRLTLSEAMCGARPLWVEYYYIADMILAAAKSVEAAR